eukprot:TRINITY_DN7975_c0_g2_i1.p1 TRINITY_DN7975_c0_g2~~TRINITY_DN7975_c0_g2_i1.p1  ORF type:complete len:122 (+),score=12.22 TRINITY_DN7975_c0_g2_i1:34-366(+)
MFKKLIITVVCIAVLVAAGGSCPKGCPDGEICCHSENVSYNGKCYDTSTQTCCQTMGAPNICNKTTQHCTFNYQGCQPGPTFPPICNKSRSSMLLPANSLPSAKMFLANE